MVEQEIFHLHVRHKVFLVEMHHKMEIPLVVVEVEQLKLELVHQVLKVLHLQVEEVEQEHLIVFQDQLYLTLVVAVVEQVIMEHQDQDQLEQHHHVEQVELEVKLTVEQVDLELQTEVVEV